MSMEEDKIFDIRNDAMNYMGNAIADALDCIFKAEKKLKNLFGEHYVESNYHISTQEGDRTIFATFKIRKGTTKIEHTFIYDIWHSFAGFENDINYLRLEINKFIDSIKYI